MKRSNQFEHMCSTPRIIDYNNHDKYEYAGASGGYLDLLGYPFCRGRIVNTIES